MDVEGNHHGSRRTLRRFTNRLVDDLLMPQVNAIEHPDRQADHLRSGGEVAGAVNDVHWGALPGQFQERDHPLFQLRLRQAEKLAKWQGVLDTEFA